MTQLDSADPAGSAGSLERPTQRSQAKADRRAALLEAAAAAPAGRAAPGAPRPRRGRGRPARRAALLEAAAGLSAERGLNGVSIEALGSSVGVSGPAVYRHFSSKQAVLEALLIGVSER